MFSDGSSIVIRHVHSAIGDLIQKCKTKTNNKKNVFLRGHMLLAGGNYYECIYAYMYSMDIYTYLYIYIYLRYTYRRSNQMTCRLDRL